MSSFWHLWPRSNCSRRQSEEGKTMGDEELPREAAQAKVWKLENLRRVLGSALQKHSMGSEERRVKDSWTRGL